ncbi:MAG: hypothetical protein ACHQQQ_02525 [Bacteroidota bacterium]
MKTTTSMGAKSRRIIELAQQANTITLSDPTRINRLKYLGQKVDEMLGFVYGYTQINDPKIAGDDEIINWTFVDVSDDINAAAWNLCSGFYKSAATLLRNALDIATVSLYFQAREDFTKNGDEKYFSEWECGKRDTPNWREMKTLINKLQPIKDFNIQDSCDIVNEIYSHFQYLCNFTHSRPYSNDDDLPTNSINMGADTPDFDEQLFERICELTEDTIGWICTIWLVIYPKILKTNPLGDTATMDQYEKLLNVQRGMDALKYADKLI